MDEKEQKLNKKISEWLFELIDDLDGAGLVITNQEEIKSILEGDETEYGWEYIKSLIRGA